MTEANNTDPFAEFAISSEAISPPEEVKIPNDMPTTTPTSEVVPAQEKDDPFAEYRISAEPTESLPVATEATETTPEQISPVEEVPPEVPQEQVVGVVDRFLMKNLIPNSPELQKAYLEKDPKYENVQIRNGQVVATNKETGVRGVIDPEGIDAQDALDLIGDVADMALTGLGAVVGSAGGPVGAVAGGAAGASTAEAGRQFLAEKLGLREDISGADIATSGVLGGLGGAIGGGVGKVAGAVKESGIRTARKLGLSSSRVKQMSTEAFEDLGKLARDSGILKAKTPMAMADKAKQELDKVGKVLESGYDAISAANPKVPKAGIINQLSSQAAEEFPEAKAERLIRKELNSLLGSKKDLSVSDIWKLTQKLEDRARVFQRSTQAAEGTKGEILAKAARRGRDFLEQKASPELIEKSRTFSKLKTIEDGLNSSRAKFLTQGAKDKRLPVSVQGVISDLIGIGPTPPAVPTAIGAGATFGATKSFLERLEESKEEL